MGVEFGNRGTWEFGNLGTVVAFRNLPALLFLLADRSVKKGPRVSTFWDPSAFSGPLRQKKDSVSRNIIIA